MPPSFRFATAVLLVSHAAASGNWTKVTLDLNRYPLARCLDGSAGAYYLSRGADPSFLLHLQGGGWCTSLADCAQRAAPGFAPYAGQPSLGGTGAWAASGCPPGMSLRPPAGAGAPVCVADGGDHGAISDDAAVNPLFSSWTKAFLGYCSGDSFAGAAAEPLVVNSTTSFFFRGRHILDAMMDSLLRDQGLATSPAVVIKGCSAGGMAVFLHAERLAAQVRAANPRAAVVASPGAGAILLTPSLQGDFPLDPQLRWLWSNANMSGSADPACLAAHAADCHRCFYPQFSLPFASARTPLFVANSMADLAQASVVMNLGCNPVMKGSCSAQQIGYLNGFRAAMIDALAPVLRSDVHGAFLVECFVHVLENDDAQFSKVLVQNQTLRDTMAAWLPGALRRGSAAGGLGGLEHPADPSTAPRRIVVDGEWTLAGSSNPTCLQ